MINASLPFITFMYDGDHLKFYLLAEDLRGLAVTIIRYDVNNPVSITQISDCGDFTLEDKEWGTSLQHVLDTMVDHDASEEQIQRVLEFYRTECCHEAQSTQA